MMRLKVADMSCGHCAGVITKAMKALDPNATVMFDMHNRMIEVDTGKAPNAVMAALDSAGYPAMPAA